MRLVVWLVIVTLLLLGRFLGDLRYTAAIAPLVIAALWFGAPVFLRGAIAAVAAALLIASLAGGVALLVGVLPCVFAALIGWLFARSLLRGRQPLIVRAIGILDGDEPLADPAVIRYATRLTCLWALCQFLLAAFGLLCAVHATWGWPNIALPAPGTFGALILPLAVVALFVGEFFLRPHLLPQAPRTHLIAFVRELGRIWPQLIER